MTAPRLTRADVLAELRAEARQLAARTWEETVAAMEAKVLAVKCDVWRGVGPVDG